MEIHAATLTKMIERLTLSVNTDPMILYAFLATFRAFVTPLGLFELLKARFNWPTLKKDFDDKDALVSYLSSVVVPIHWKYIYSL